ncbi:MAG: tRNA-intron lyase [Candidatus Rehaiarchaeum fermentans]|nr:tRNA-intron lyase [Candidatus Rehaiarchaeum fermentans]
MQGEIFGNRVVVDVNEGSELLNKNFGVKKDNKIFLFPEEALYLTELGKLNVKYKNKNLNFKELLSIFKIKDLWSKYLVYKDLRSNGYIPKEALKYGGDFRVYDKDQSLESHSKWICIVIKDYDVLSPRQLSAIARVTHTVRKKLLIAVVDKEDEITYYELDWIKI